MCDALREVYWFLLMTLLGMFLMAGGLLFVHVVLPEIGILNETQKILGDGIWFAKTTVRMIGSAFVVGISIKPNRRLIMSIYDDKFSLYSFASVVEVYMTLMLIGFGVITEVFILALLRLS